MKIGISINDIYKRCVVKNKCQMSMKNITESGHKRQKLTEPKIFWKN